MRQSEKRTQSRIHRPLLQRPASKSAGAQDPEQSKKAKVTIARRDGFRRVLPLIEQGSREIRIKEEPETTGLLDRGNNESSSAEREALEIARYSLEHFSDKLDPFAQLPIVLDRFQEHLVNFYLRYYPTVTYGMSQALKPHPVSVNFSIAINNPPNFQVALARSALYRISLDKYSGPAEKRDLEIAVMKHKGEAIRMVKEMSNDLEKHKAHSKDMLIAAIVSLGTLDTRTGSKETASMHFMAVRQLLRSIGGPLKLKSVLLSRVMVHFECLYATTKTSWVWDKSVASDLLIDLNAFLADIWTLWSRTSSSTSVRRSSTQSTSSSTDIALQGTILEPLTQAYFLRPGTDLHEGVSRPLPRDSHESTSQDRMKLTFQLCCLMTLCHAALDKQSDARALKTWMENLYFMIHEAQLTGQPANNHLWLIQVHDQSSSHDKRVWRCAGFVWLLRHFPYNIQKSLRDWMLAFLEGESTAGKQMKSVDTFHFSYACNQP